MFTELSDLLKHLIRARILGPEFLEMVSLVRIPDQSQEIVVCGEQGLCGRPINAVLYRGKRDDVQSKNVRIYSAHREVLMKTPTMTCALCILACLRAVPAFPSSCDGLAALALKDTTITMAQGCS